MTFPTSRFVVITGTDTGVGKTVTTAALAVAFEALGRSV
ncbi:MAG: dethiobiotin synthase, partial [Kineosporiaceae bacterium]|nr:dethiobiotin synthase [Aeromicrobium sp.]